MSSSARVPLANPLLDLGFLGGLSGPTPGDPPVSQDRILDKLKAVMVESASGEEEDPKKLATAALFGGTIGAALGNIVPDPGDLVYIAGQRYLETHPDMSEAKHWAVSLGSYYLPSMAWWAAMAVLAYKTKGLKTKIAVVGGVVTAGAIVSLVANWIIKEKS